MTTMFIPSLVTISPKMNISMYWKLEHGGDSESGNKGPVRPKNESS